MDVATIIDIIDYVVYNVYATIIHKYIVFAYKTGIKLFSQSVLVLLFLEFVKARLSLAQQLNFMIVGEVCPLTEKVTSI